MSRSLTVLSAMSPEFCQAMPFSSRCAARELRELKASMTFASRATRRMSSRSWRDRPMAFHAAGTNVRRSPDLSAPPFLSWRTLPVVRASSTRVWTVAACSSICFAKARAARPDASAVTSSIFAAARALRDQSSSACCPSSRTHTAAASNLGRFSGVGNSDRPGSSTLQQHHSAHGCAPQVLKPPPGRATTVVPSGQFATHGSKSGSGPTSNMRPPSKEIRRAPDSSSADADSAIRPRSA